MKSAIIVETLFLRCTGGAPGHIHQSRSLEVRYGHRGEVIAAGKKHAHIRLDGHDPRLRFIVDRKSVYIPSEDKTRWCPPPSRA